MNISEQLRRAGQRIAAATDEDIVPAINDALPIVLGDEFRSMPASVVDETGTQSAVFGSVVYRGIIENVGEPPAVPADETAAVIDACAQLTLEGLRGSFARIAHAKTLKKTPVENEQVRTNITLGIIIAARSAVPLEAIAEELARLNAKTSGKQWPDMIVITDSAVINYVVQFPGEPLGGDFLPPAENATRDSAPAIYVLAVMRPTGDYAFNKMLVFLRAHLALFSPNTKLPKEKGILDGVSNHALTHAGYQYKLNGEIAPVPRQFYNNRHLPRRPLVIEGPNKEAVGFISYLPWQDGGVVLFNGKLPLEGVLVFLGNGKIENARVIRRPNFQISSVLPISEADFDDMLLRFQRQSNMSVRPEDRGFLIQKLADEGTGTPFIARIMLGIMKLRDTVYTDEPRRKQFDRPYENLILSLLNARTLSQDVCQTWEVHARNVATGRIAQIKGGRPPHLREHRQGTQEGYRGFP